MAMGSGAFLVQACRYLSERLVESWENMEKQHPGEVLITPEGQVSQGDSSMALAYSFSALANPNPNYLRGGDGRALKTSAEVLPIGTKFMVVPALERR